MNLFTALLRAQASRDCRENGGTQLLRQRIRQDLLHMAREHGYDARQQQQLLDHFDSQTDAEVVERARRYGVLS